MLIQRQRRIWRAYTATSGAIPAETAPPGITGIEFSVPWTAEHVALAAAGHLYYWGIMRAHARQPDDPPPGAYPPYLSLCSAWTPAGGSQTLVDIEDLPPIPLNLGGDNKFICLGGLHFLATPGVGLYPAFVEGENKVSLCIANPSAGQDAQFDVCSFSMVEIECDASLVYSESNVVPIPPT